MKKMLLGLCALLGATTTFAQKETVSGNGNVISRDVTVSSFETLKASGVYELKLSQGDKESVKIEADENLMPFFDVRNEGSMLVIDMNKKKNLNIRKSTKMVVHVTFKSLRSLDLNMVGNVRSEESLSFSDVKVRNNSVGNVTLQLTANNFKLHNNSVGNVTLTGKAQAATFDNNAVGAIRAGDFVVQTVKIDNDGVGSAEVNAEKSLEVKDSFLGKVKNRGAAKASKKEVI